MLKNVDSEIEGQQDVNEKKFGREPVIEEDDLDKTSVERRKSIAS